MDDYKSFIKYLKSLGLEVNTSTKARGHQGFFVKNRIDISKNIPQDKILPTLVHEFTHYIHSKIEPQMIVNGGSIEVIFDDNRPDFYNNELISVTNFVDNNSKCEFLINNKELIKSKIAEYEQIIRKTYPNFQRSKKFLEFEKFIKGSNVRYLLKYDRVKLVTNSILSKNKTDNVLSINTLEEDFPELGEAFCAYIRLKSCQRKQARISSRINKLNKYYLKPTELFARFTQGLCIDAVKTKSLAPNCYKRFLELLESGYYLELSNITNYITLLP